MPVLRSAAQRSAELSRRASFKQTLALSVDDALAKAAESSHERETTPSCLSGIYRLATGCTIWRRHQRLLDIDVLAPETRAASTTFVSPRVDLLFFGQRRTAGNTSTAATKLAEVGQSLDARIATVEEKAAASKVEAANLFAAGSKAAALRVLRRSKAHEKQAAALSDTAVAIERQSAMLEDAGLQQMVANAVQAGVKGMKKTAKALKDVESVVDEAAEMRDMSEDINSALAELGAAYEDPGVNDDDLLGELEEMASAAAAKSHRRGSSENVLPTAYPTSFPDAPQGALTCARAATTGLSNSLRIGRGDSGQAMKNENSGRAIQHGS